MLVTFSVNNLSQGCFLSKTEESVWVQHLQVDPVIQFQLLFQLMKSSEEKIAKQNHTDLVQLTACEEIEFHQ